MTAPLERVRALLARAADDGASEEERRTSAVIAARLIKQHEIAIGAPERVVYRDRIVPVRRAEPDRVVLRSRYDGHCRRCGDAYREGARIAWAKGAGAWCLDCWRRAA